MKKKFALENGKKYQKKIHVKVYLSDEHYEKLKKIAEKKELSMSNILRQCAIAVIEGKID